MNTQILPPQNSRYPIKHTLSTPIHIRYMLVIAFMAIYIAAGFLLHLSVTAYLLLGIPLTIVFQLWIARKPLHLLWMRHERSFSLSNAGWLIALVLLILPVYNVITLAAAHKLSPSVFGYYCAVIAGAFPAGYCFGRLTRRTAQDLLGCSHSSAFATRMPR